MESEVFFEIIPNPFSLESTRNIENDLEAFLADAFDDTLLYEDSDHQSRLSDDSDVINNKRRRFESESQSSDEPSMSKVPSVILDSKSAHIIPAIITNAMNQGSPHIIAAVISQTFHPNCHFVLAHPSNQIDRYGSNVGIELMKALMDSQPDLISVTKGTKISQYDNTVRIVIQKRCMGTLLFRKIYNRFLEEPENALVSDYMFDPSKT